MQRSPLSEKTPKRAESIAASRSASAKTTQGDLPPSSIERPLRFAAALRKIVWPVVVSPVKEISGTSGCLTSASPASSPRPLTRLKTPSGRPASLKICGPQGGGERGELGGLEHHGVAGGQRRGELPGLEHERGVPRGDEAGDADRLAVDVVDLGAGDLHGVVELGHDQVREEAEVLGRAQGLALGLGDRQAGVEGLEFGEPGLLGLDGVGDPVQDAGALAGLHLRPRAVGEGLAGGGDGEVDVLLLAGGGGGVVRVGHRVQDVEGLAADGVNELAVDVVLDVGGQVLRDVVGGGF